ncbi:MAG TPA: hypothetical protein VGT01_10295 [Candidatus Dormibacteraeota bacterium]|nr:hypothetical protein [Candidatus Dormibacteraeota bacterium]
MRKLGAASRVMDDMTTLSRARILRVAGLSIGAVAVGVAAIAVTASASGMTLNFNRTSSPQPAAASSLTAVDASSASAQCSAFMKHFAVEIGKTQAQISSAFQKAIADTLADEVKAGQITQAQADAIKAKLANQTPCTLPAVRTPGGDKSAIGAYMQQYLAAAATALGITQTQLTTDLKSGESLSQIAAAQHVSEADFRTRLVAGLKPALDQAVSQKKITSAQEQTIIGRLQTGPLPLWILPLKRPKPAASPAPAA